MNGNQAYILSKGYTKKSLDGVGAIKGSPATIKSIVDNGDGTHTITFEWESNSGVKSTSDLIVKDGTDGTNGKSITGVAIDGSNHLIVTFPVANYEVAFHANIQIPEGGTIEEISLALAIDGDVDPSSTMIYVPAAVEEFGNVGADIIVSVPWICRCSSVSVRNTSTQDIEVQNANIVFDFSGIRS